MDTPDLSLLDMIPVAELQQIQDSFAQATGVAATITDINGNPLTQPSNHSKVCRLIRGTEKGLANCIRSGKRLGAEANQKRTPVHRACFGIGFTDASAPIVVEGHHIANWLIGQYHTAGVDKHRVAAYARQIGMEQDTLLQAFADMPKISISRFENILDFLWIMANKVSSMAYTNIQLADQNHRLNQTEAELKRHQEELEEMVRQRTAHLDQANNALRLEVKDRKAAEMRSRQSEKELRKLMTTTVSILESLPLGVVIVGTDRVIQKANRAAIDMMGLASEAEIVGRRCHNRICPAPDCQCPVLDLGQTVESAEKVLIGADERRIPVVKSVIKIRLEKEDILLEAFADVTMLKATEAQLEQKNAQVVDANRQLKAAAEKAKQLATEAEAANEAKTRFLANMSHEIRTPMNAIIGLTDLALKTDLNAQQSDYLSKVSGSAQTLLRLLNNILDLSKIEAGRMDLEHIDFRLADILAQVDSVHGHNAEEKKIGLHIACDADVPDALCGDPLRLTQVLHNLIGNAVKFTDTGMVNVIISVAQRHKDQIRLHFRIEDTGIGLTGQQIERLFSPFVQADSSSTRRYGGTGLGLVISKQIVGLMGGRIWIDSTPGAGTTFHVVAPFGFRVDATASRTSAGKDIEDFDDIIVVQEKLRGSRILVVEDNAINRQIATELLLAVGCRVTHAENGTEALDRVGTDRFDAVLMDIQMPVMDGYEATVAIRRSDNGSQKVPIIALTASVLASDQKKCVQAGMNGFVTKPIVPEQLYRALIASIKKPLATGARISQPPTIPSPNAWPTLPGIDCAAGIKRLGGNSQLYFKLLREFVHENTAFEQSLQLLIDKNDFEGAARKIHTIKGVCGNLNANDLHQAAQTLETQLAQNVFDHDQFAQFKKTLSNTLKAIAQILQGGDNPTRAAIDANYVEIAPHEIQRRFDRLAGLIREHDVDSEDECISLGRYLGKTDRLRQLQKDLAAFEYAAAMQKLDRLRASYLTEQGGT